MTMLVGLGCCSRLPKASPTVRVVGDVPCCDPCDPPAFPQATQKARRQRARMRLRCAPRMRLGLMALAPLLSSLRARFDALSLFLLCRSPGNSVAWSAAVEQQSKREVVLSGESQEQAVKHQIIR